MMELDEAIRKYIQAVGQYTTARTNAICYWLIEACTVVCLALAVSQYNENAKGFEEYGMYAVTLALFLFSFAGAVFCIWLTMSLANKRHDMQQCFKTMRRKWIEMNSLY